MSDFKAKMHQIRFRLGFCPRPRWGAYSAPPDTLAGFKGPTSKGREEAKGKGSKREGEGKGKGAKGGTPLCSQPPLLKNPGYGPDPRRYAQTDRQLLTDWLYC